MRSSIVFAALFIAVANGEGKWFEKGCHTFRGNVVCNGFVQPDASEHDKKIILRKTIRGRWYLRTISSEHITDPHGNYQFTECLTLKAMVTFEFRNVCGKGESRTIEDPVEESSMRMNVIIDSNELDYRVAGK